MDGLDFLSRERLPSDIIVLRRDDVLGSSDSCTNIVAVAFLRVGVANKEEPASTEGATVRNGNG